MHDELTYEQAAELLLTPKWVVNVKGRDGIRPVYQPIPVRDKFPQLHCLLESGDRRHYFRLSVACGKKQAFKISLHHQADPSHTGLLRVDYRGWHTNPTEESAGLPARFVPHIRAKFTPDQPHIHYHVPGYKTLAWAVPLTDDDFPVKIVESDDQISDAILAFGETISLKTELKPQANLFDGQ